jgi:hypothetical protein
VEVDETYVGRGRTSGRETHTKTLVAVAAEENGQGIGRIRLARIADVFGDSLGTFIVEMIEPGSVVHTDGWWGYLGVQKLGYEHKVTNISRSGKPAHEALVRRALTEAEDSRLFTARAEVNTLTAPLRVPLRRASEPCPVASPGPEAGVPQALFLTAARRSATLSPINTGGGRLQAGVEDRLDRPAEEAGDAECEGQAGVVLACLDGVDGLAGDAEVFGQVAL